jgi:hypothetical protein
VTTARRLVCQGRKSRLACGTCRLRSDRFDPIAEASEFSDHSRGAGLLYHGTQRAAKRSGPTKFSHVVNVERRTWTYLEAASGRFLVKGDELGDYALCLERDVKPIRLVCRGINRVMTARLVDDSGRDDAATSRFFTFRRPAEPITLNPDTILTGFQNPFPGGFLEARHEHLDTMIVSIPHIEGGFQGLVIEPDLHDVDSDTVQVAYLLELLRSWSEARLFGPLVGMRRGRIVERLTNRLYFSTLWLTMG